MRADAVAMLEEAFTALTRERVIPVPRLASVRARGRDYYGEDVMNGPAFKQFGQTLLRLFPFHSRGLRTRNSRRNTPTCLH
ncbi:MAG: hypothetical protein LC808_37610 [Actinobacteria bacterium]|nr:hypothetical protein [Actinomycetota bacterium]